MTAYSRSAPTNPLRIYSHSRNHQVSVIMSSSLLSLSLSSLSLSSFSLSSFSFSKIQTKFHFFVTLPTRLRSKSSVSRKSSNSMRAEMHSPEQKIQVKCRPEIVLILCRNPRTREQKIWVAAFVLERSKEICLTWPDGPTQNISVGNAANGSHSHSPS